jgi:hypothetical protein
VHGDLQGALGQNAAAVIAGGAYLAWLLIRVTTGNGLRRHLPSVPDGPWLIVVVAIMLVWTVLRNTGV